MKYLIILNVIFSLFFVQDSHKPVVKEFVVTQSFKTHQFNLLGTDDDFVYYLNDYDENKDEIFIYLKYNYDGELRYSLKFPIKPKTKFTKSLFLNKNIVALFCLQKSTELKANIITKSDMRVNLVEDILFKEVKFPKNFNIQKEVRFTLSKDKTMILIEILNNDNNTIDMYVYNEDLDFLYTKQVSINQLKEFRKKSNSLIQNNGDVIILSAHNNF